MAKNTKEKIVVHIDPELKELIPVYIENRNRDIDDMTEALENGDFTLIQSLSHSMKGSGGGYGFDTITDIGKVLEQAAKSGDKTKIKQYICELKNYLSALEIVYE
jgi:HPt (histidine-containing phosphotransfer) domain-containing protein